jgi:multicomponent K+:H+ antiporter subunit G
MLDYFLSFLILTGAIFTFIGSLGLVRLKDFYTRLHGPTKATTLGVGSLLIASVIFFSTRGTGVSLHELLITLFLFITAPVSAHMLAKAALHLNLDSLAKMPEEKVLEEEGDKEEKEKENMGKTDDIQVGEKIENIPASKPAPKNSNETLTDS